MVCASDSGLAVTLYKVSRKTGKNTVFSHFSWDVMQNAQETLFFRIFANFVQCAPKNGKRTLFSHTFCGTSCKMLKKRRFSHFLRTLYKVLRKTGKEHCFLTLFVGRRAKC